MSEVVTGDGEVGGGDREPSGDGRDRGDGRGGDSRGGGRDSSKDTVSRSARWLVGVLLAALLVPGLVGFELWPLTGWRLFSVSRSDTAARWVLEGAYEDGSTRLVNLGELPMAYSNAEWPLRSVGGGSLERREELCRVLLDAVVDVDPQIVELRIARDNQQLVHADGEWTVTHDLDVRHSCAVPRGEDP